MPLNVDRISTGSLSINGTEITGGGGVTTQIIFVDMGSIPGGRVGFSIDAPQTISSVFLGASINSSFIPSIKKLTDGSYTLSLAGSVIS
jgi:hypothetical protein